MYHFWKYSDVWNPGFRLGGKYKSLIELDFSQLFQNFFTLVHNFVHDFFHNFLHNFFTPFFTTFHTCPELGADTDEYFKPGKVFEVVEEFAIGGRRFLCLPDGRFVKDRSRKDIQKVVAKRLEVSTGKCPKSVRR